MQAPKKIGHSDLLASLNGKKAILPSGQIPKETSLVPQKKQSYQKMQPLNE